MVLIEEKTQVDIDVDLADDQELVCNMMVNLSRELVSFVYHFLCVNSITLTECLVVLQDLGQGGVIECLKVKETISLDSQRDIPNRFDISALCDVMKDLMMDGSRSSLYEEVFEIPLLKDFLNYYQVNSLLLIALLNFLKSYSYPLFLGPQ
jgi:hypothetical protein